jgi:hypothetical protein
MLIYVCRTMKDVDGVTSKVNALILVMKMVNRRRRQGLLECVQRCVVVCRTSLCSRLAEERFGETSDVKMMWAGVKSRYTSQLSPTSL